MKLQILRYSILIVQTLSVAAGLLAGALQDDGPKEVQSRPSSSPRPSDGRLQSALRAYQLRDYPRAESELRAGLKIEPDRAELLLRLGIVLYRLQRWTEAIEPLKKSLEIDPGNIGELQVIGHCHFELGELEPALEWYDKVIAKKPANREAWRGKGFTLEKMGKLEEAEGALRTALALNPESAAVHTWLGRVLRKKKQFGSAVPYLEKARKLDAFDWECEFELSRAYEAMGETARAKVCRDRSDLLRSHRETINDLKRALLVNANDVNTLVQLAMRYDSIGDIINARGAWERAREMSRDDPTVTSAQAWSLVVNGNAAAAEDLLRRRVKERPNDPVLWESLWFVLIRRDDAKGAAEAASRFKQLTNRDPKEPAPWMKPASAPASTPAPASR